ncbi:MAG: bacterial ammonia monooxygenase, subunit AmoA [Gammaproteobacteria bacterium]
MSASQSAVRSRAEAVKVSRTLDYMILFVVFFIVLGGYHIHFMLTGGDWDFWTDWKDRRLWVTVVPIVAVTFPAAVQAFAWGRYRLPWGATVCVLGLLFGEWVNRYFNFWGWTYFPVNFVFPSQLIPSAIILDVVLLLSNSYTLTAVVGAMGWGLIFYPSNWPVIAPLHVPVEYNGMMMTLADLQGYHYVRTGTPEYIRMVEKGTLRTFGKDVAPVSAFFSAFMSILIYFMWHFLGEWFCSTKRVQST